MVQIIRGKTRIVSWRKLPKRRFSAQINYSSEDCSSSRPRISPGWTEDSIGCRMSTNTPSPGERTSKIKPGIRISTSRSPRRTSSPVSTNQQLTVSGASPVPRSGSRISISVFHSFRDEINIAQAISGFPIHPSHHFNINTVWICHQKSCVCFVQRLDDMNVLLQCTMGERFNIISENHQGRHGL